MKKLTPIYLAFASLLLLTFSSCQKIDITADERADFLENKTELEVKQEFFRSDGATKLSLWKSKIDQLARLNLPEEHSRLLTRLREELNNADSYDNLMLDNNLRDIALNLASITPERDFVEMFSSLSDYNYSGEFSKSKKCESCIFDIRNYQETSDDNTTLRADKKTCNCRWCTLSEILTGEDSTDDCETKPGRKGCGWLWLQDCDRRIG